jgi:hypothetical protein
VILMGVEREDRASGQSVRSGELRLGRLGLGLDDADRGVPVFDRERKLLYTGRGVDQPRDASKVTVNDLERVLEEVTAGLQVTVPVTNPIGCNVKWEGKDKHWMPADACDLT